MPVVVARVITVKIQQINHVFELPGTYDIRNTRDTNLPVTLAGLRAFDQRDERPCEASKGARFRRRVVAVPPGPEHEREQRENHDEARDAEAEPPANVILDVAGDNGRHGRAGAHAEVPPVEEGAPRHRLLGIELVRGERLRAGLVRGLGQRHQVQGDVEDGHLYRGRGTGEGLGGVVAAAVVVERGDCQHAQALRSQE
jgi:hypothetical protein